ncbi:MAG: phosphomannomutase/phosphoglucomutase [Bdellovibrionales bacterium]|nr:phosphomannomutase/phosphoglucomutase [Bdellovibrionales bacterium]
MKWNEKIFRKNDIRGIYKKDFDLAFVKDLAFSFTQLYFQEQKKENPLMPPLVIAVGHDCRLSSPEITQHLINSFTLTGAEILFLGMVPAPVCLFTSYFLKDINASIMVTASHNPRPFNGFKMVLNKESVCDKKILKLKKIMQTHPPLPVIPNQYKKRRKGKVIPFDIKPAYISFYTDPVRNLQTRPSTTSREEAHRNHKSLSPQKREALWKSGNQTKSVYQKTALFLQKPLPRSLPIKSLVIDCGNGASGPIAQKVFKALKLPIKIHWLYTKPDGRFPHHHPDPSLEKNLKDLQKTIKEKKSDFGAALDGDGDRLVIVGKEGRILQGDELMSIFISDILSSSAQIKTEAFKKTFSIVADVKCADWFFHFLNKKNIRSIMWKSGHSLIRQKTIKEKALFGGELSGHFFFLDDFFPIDDGIYSLLRLIYICLSRKKSLNELRIKTNSIETKEIRFPIKTRSSAQKHIENLKRYYSQQEKHLGDLSSFIDGVRVSFPNQAWGLARLSNTQNEWTLRFGGKNKIALQQIQNDFYRLLHISPIREEIG